MDRESWVCSGHNLRYVEFEDRVIPEIVFAQVDLTVRTALMMALLTKMSTRFRSAGWDPASPC